MQVLSHGGGANVDPVLRTVQLVRTRNEGTQVTNRKAGKAGRNESHPHKR
jgi:hypothetical protein